jgi:hypothetical protein
MLMPALHPLRCVLLCCLLILVPATAAQAATLYLSPSGSDTASCTSSAPCKSFGRAYAVAAQGDTVLVAGGTYGDQVLAYDASKTSDVDVTFKPASGAAPKVGFLDFGQYYNDLGGRHITVQDMDIDGFTANRAQDVTFRNVDMHGNFWTNGADSISIIGGSVGGTANGTHPDIQVWKSGSTEVPSSNILIDGVHLHDVLVQSASDHVECLQVSDVDGLTIRNSHFGPNCDTFGLHIQTTEWGVKNITIENSTFDEPTDSCGCLTAYHGLSIRNGVNVTLRNNSSAAGWYMPDDNAGASNFKVIGNVLDKDFCHPYATYSKNVWIAVSWRDAGGCGSTDQYVNDAGFVSATDLHLKSSSPAVNAGDPASYPATDKDGNARPAGGAPDAGAYEYGSSTGTGDTTAPDTSITAQPAASTTSTSASFSFTATEGGSTFACKLDAGSYAACTSPKAYSGLAVGAHTFSVRATDAAGNVDASPATATWTVTAPADTTPPDTSITAQPAASTTSTSASFSFTATEGGATFQCKLDAGSYAVCTSPKAYTSLAVGSHTFSVRATDAAGNTDASPATATWTVTAPSAPALGAPSSSVVDAAKAVPLIRYGRQYSGGGMTNDAWNTGPSLVLAAAAYAGNTSADARLLAQVRDLIAGGNEPVSNGGYPAQHERFGTATLAVARRTPRIWGQLTAAEQHKVDLVMQGMLYSSAFTTSDTNPYVSSNGQQRTLDGDTDVHRDWNPNYREGMLGGVVQAIGYFGPATTQSLLTGYDPAAFLTDLRANGLTNLADTFNYKVDHPSSVAPSASTVAATVRTFKYYGITVADPMGLYWALTDDTFGAHVTCGLNGGAGVATADGQAGMLVSGCSGLPNQGALGMALELDSGDAGGARSSAQYAYDGAKVNVVNAYVLVVSGVWAAGADASAATARLRIGMPDLWYKLDRGYRGYAKGAAQWIYGAPSSDPYVYRSDNPNYGFPYNRTLWYDVMAPYLGL